MAKSLSLLASMFLVSILSLPKDSYAQNIGIGTNTPTYKLDVRNGTINTDSVYRIYTFPVLSTLGNSNLFLGRYAGYVNTGSNNTFAGNAAGKDNSSGTYNSFFGSYAGAQNTIGSSNAFFGLNAGADNLDGSDNSIFGRNAGGHNISGSGNCFYGRSTGISNTTGDNNIGIGIAALYYNTTSSNNIAIGDSALFSQGATWPAIQNIAIGSKAGFNNSTGYANLFLGDSAGYSNYNGYHNEFIGYMAGNRNSSGTNNLFIGSQTGVSNTSGSANTFIGNDAGGFNITGGHLTMIGFGAYPISSNLQNATAIGYVARVNCDNCMALGGTTSIGNQTRVGINNTTPLTDLHIIQQTDANLDNTRGIRLQRPSGNQWRVFLDPLNNFIFQYNNNVYAYLEPVNGTLISSSDVRLKKDISSMDQVLDKLLLLQPKTYHYIASRDANRTSWGFLAQDVEKLFPDFVFSSENGMKGVAYSNFSVIAVKAIQEQQQLINDQRKEIDQLKQQMELMLKRMESFDELRIDELRIDKLRIDKLSIEKKN